MMGQKGATPSLGVFDKSDQARPSSHLSIWVFNLVVIKAWQQSDYMYKNVNDPWQGQPYSQN